MKVRRWWALIIGLLLVGNMFIAVIRAFDGGDPLLVFQVPFGIIGLVLLYFAFKKPREGHQDG